MTEMVQSRTDPNADPADGVPGEIASLPFVGPTTIEDVAFYAVLGVATVVELVSWPTAALIGSAHVLHQRARNLVAASKERGEVIEGVLEAGEDIL